MLNRLRRLLLRAVVAILLALLIMLTPLPSGAPPWVTQAQVAIAVIFLVCALGKLLYDTLFYNHYWP